MYKQIKPDMIYHYFDQDIELIYEIIELVIDLNIQDLKNLMPLYDLGEIEAIKQKFHKSKPVFGFLGASGINGLIETIELDIRGQFPIYYDELLLILHELEDDLHSFLKKINQ
ncbi:Hpt domain-containing protein [Cyclobacterium sp.]|uniref:Hpt domain-containing protein n=1 Tax=Cyclobacterium sp. TaxID=1966343 RepID=UPI0019866777|nr:Hpt domain-containing protein [Cyclobacterium sp.]MBD3629011.1 Hpt domain-containing protein [Cyclobacterium sp.]